MLNHLVSGMPEGLDSFCELFTKIAVESFSFFDVGDSETSERFYHAFVLGLVVDLREDYVLTSNHESGLGRYDIMLTPRDMSKPGLIFEFKVVKGKKTPKKVAAEALKQIRTKEYWHVLKAQGVSQIVSIGCAFSGKTVQVVYESRADKEARMTYETV